MTQKPTPLTPALYDYYQSIGFREHPVLGALRSYNQTLPQRDFQSAPEVAHFLAFLVSLLGARSILEVGTFTGYGTLALALNLPEDGHIITCDKDPKTAAIAKDYFEKAGVSRKITLKLGDAPKTLNTLLEEGHTFDLIFVDANKNGYDVYYEAALKLVRPNGLIVLDNTLWHGRVVHDPLPDTQSKTIKALNEKIHQDPRVTMLMLPLADGLTLVRRT
jgi:O-methyltransferase